MNLKLCTLVITHLEALLFESCKVVNDIKMLFIHLKFAVFQRQRFATLPCVFSTPSRLDVVLRRVVRFY